MKKTPLVVAIFSLLASMAPSLAVAEPLPPNPRLAPLQPLIGETWRGSFPGSTAEKPATVACT